MSANLQETASKVQLEVILPDFCALRWHHAALCGILTVLFLYFSYLPVSDLETWNLVASGLVADHHSHGIPLSVGIRHFEIAWASQSTAAWIYQFGGAESLSFAFAIVQTLTLICWAFVFRRISKRWWSMFAVAAVFLASQPSSNGFSSVTLGQFLLTLFMILMTRRFAARHDDQGSLAFRWSMAGRFEWIGVACLFVVWSNISASFVLGIGWLIGSVIARWIDLVHDRSSGLGWTDRELQSRLWLTELAFVATAINPSGTQLWGALLWWPDNPVVQSFGGWNPTVMASRNGILLIAAWVVIVAVSRRRSIATLWWIHSIAMTIAIAMCGPLMFWLAPLMICTLFAMIGQSHASVSQTIKSSPNDSDGALKFAYSLVTLLILWVGFSFCPWGSLVLGGQTRTEKQLISERLPRGLRDYLQQNSTQGMVVCPVAWSDWLQVETALPMFRNGNPYLVPASVNDDFQHIQRGASDWQSIAEKYALSTLVIDKQRQRQLVRTVRQTPGSWKIAYEDSQAILLTSKR